MPNESDGTIRRKIKTARETAGYSQKQIADILGVDRTTYAKYESGLRSPGTDVISKLSEFYSLSVDDIFEIERTNEDNDPFMFVRSENVEFVQYPSLTEQEISLITLFNECTRKQDIIDFARKICCEDAEVIKEIFGEDAANMVLEKARGNIIALPEAEIPDSFIEIDEECDEGESEDN